MVATRLFPSLARLLLPLLLALPVPPAFAQGSPPAKSEEQRLADLRAAWQAAGKVVQAGPGSIKLIDQGSITLEKGIVFIRQPEASNLMSAMGNTPNPRLIGLITADSNDSNWIVAVSFIKEGYVKDEDARNWNADDLLQSLKEGTEQANASRRARGFPALLINGWVEPPAYDAATRRLVWSLSARSEGAPANEPQTINYNTYQLGREGFFSLNMLTDSASIDKDKPVARTLLAGLAFEPGKTYDEFNASTDNVAAYGLAALVGGAVLKKAGFFALVLAMIAKFWKVGALLVVAAGIGLKKLLDRKKAQG